MQYGVGTTIFVRLMGRKPRGRIKGQGVRNEGPADARADTPIHVSTPPGARRCPADREIHVSPQVYTRLGVEPFINCTATVTLNGGSRTLPAVVAAMHQAISPRW